MDNDSPPEDDSQPPGYDPALSDLDDDGPQISFDFHTRGDDQDTTINDSQGAGPEVGDYDSIEEDDAAECALRALLQIDDNTPAASAPVELDEQPQALTAPVAMMDDSGVLGDASVEDQIFTEQTISNGNIAADDSEEVLTNRVQVEIEFPRLSDEQRSEYVYVESDIVEAVNGEEITDAGVMFYNVEFTDGRVELITHDSLLSKDNGLASLERYYNPPDMSSLGKRKRFDNDEWGSDQGESSRDSMELDQDEVEVPDRRRAARSRSVRSVRLQPRRAKQTRVIEDSGDEEDMLMEPEPRRSGRARRPPPPDPTMDDRDELQDDPFEDTVPIITSDIPSAGPRKVRRVMVRRSAVATARPKASGSDIEFEAPRRSNRATKYQNDMLDDADMDDESFYAVDERAPTAAPKVISIREVYRPVDPTSEFALRHNKKCHVCNGRQHDLINCQGCSLSFHKGCIGYRSAREHMVTKIGDGNFVLQCKYCIGLYRKKDKQAPRHNMCQGCGSRGQACAAFSQKLTSRQEEKLREENGGVDPTTSVSPERINNADLVLFRCIKCHRGWHTEHLPPTRASANNEDPSERFKDYAIDWKCNECNSAIRKIDKLVAWRPLNKDDAKPGVKTSELDEDSKEYLVKWQDRSYGHCVWKPSAWIFGVAPAVMRNSFAKHDLEKSRLHFTKNDAIPEEYLMPDVILAMKWSSDAPDFDSKSEELQNMSYVKKIYVKFQGLSYNDVVWDSPPAMPADEKDAPQDGASKELRARATNIYNAMGEAFFDYLEGKHFKHESQRKIRERVRDYKASPFTEVDQQPAGLTGGKLMGYQIEGLNWLLENFHRNRSVVLADEMGLGKTVQVVSLVASLAQDDPECWPFLVVVPNSTCANWRREFKKWTPELRVVTYQGGRQAQDLAYKYELFPDRTDEMRAHVVIMSYDSAADSHTKTLFKNIQWQGLVVDEGQRLKNDSNLLYQALQAMKIPFRLLLTGTPLQNNKRELFNLLQFIDGSQDAAKLDVEFEVLDKETLPKLHEKIRPYFLRRTKAGVLKFLPPMAQIILPVTMTSLQEKLSKSIMAKNPQLIKSMFANSKLKAKERGSLNNILMQLRKCLCHPFVYSDAIEERHHDQSVLHRNLVEASAKLMLLEIMLPKLKERGHRVLIFSQFLNQLDIVEDFLGGMNFGFRRLDGTISSLEKQKRIDSFNAPDSELFAFLLSTRAGGVGINLATADTVIIMDPDFNPHQDIQALSRAHRIGQKNKVLCFQLVTKDSVEERIMQIGRKKMALDHALIESMDDDDLAGDDLESILKHGAQALFDDDYQTDAIVYDSASVDKILDRTQVEKTEVTEDGSGDTQFSHARVWANEKSAFQSGLGNEEQEAPEVQVSTNVWERIIAQREEEARKEAEANREELGRGARRRTAVGNYTGIAPDPAIEVNNAASDDSSDAYSSNSGDESEEDADAVGKDDQTQAAFEADSLRPKPEKGSSSKTLKSTPNSDEKARRKGASMPNPVQDSGKVHTKQAGPRTNAQAAAQPNGHRGGQSNGQTTVQTNGAVPQNLTGSKPLYKVNPGPGRPTDRPHVPEIGSNLRNNVMLTQGQQIYPPSKPMEPPSHVLPTQQKRPSQQPAINLPGKLTGLKSEDLRSPSQLRLALDHVAREEGSSPATKAFLRTQILRRLRELSTGNANGR